VSDPGARARNSPTPVRRGRSRHGCPRRRGGRAGENCSKGVAILCTISALIAGLIVRTIRIRCVREIAAHRSRFSDARLQASGRIRSNPCECSVRSPRSTAKGDNASDDPLCAGHPAIDSRSVLGTVKVLRFAPTALARGPRALTVPVRSSHIGNYVMASGVMDESLRFLVLTSNRSGVTLSLSRRCCTHRFRAGTSPRNAERRRFQGHDQRLPDYRTLPDRYRA
jgi:hypothetical protein